MVPVRLRGHHFLCVLTYRGYGYTEPFVENMTRLVGEIEAGRPVILCKGPDDICGGFTQHCRTVSDHDCGQPHTREMDQTAVEAINALVPVQSGEPFVMDAAMIAALRSGFADNSIRKACLRCSWSDFCTQIAREEYADVKLFET
ncbi:DUF1284 domain-containing protein [Rhizobium sp. KVB221]|uniref:DUF1284 domain-containing protein n=1 Tax=Rhizobium setariae TaxID=2801340 RepID=A0A937CJ73_9HYPH|nr:DUF1284 domain-containing protein [Rhizobium setariae]MBL0370805.1 DUF1284 domain-containing protein [Rhizobium setariae]